MKRTFLATVLSIVFALVAVACHSSDEKEIGYTELPVQAQQFVKQYFPSATYTYVEKEKNNGKWEYEATLTLFQSYILSKSPIPQFAGWGISVF